MRHTYTFKDDRITFLLHLCSKLWQSKPRATQNVFTKRIFCHFQTNAHTHKMRIKCKWNFIVSLLICAKDIRPKSNYLVENKRKKTNFRCRLNVILLIWLLFLLLLIWWKTFGWNCLFGILANILTYSIKITDIYWDSVIYDLYLLHLSFSNHEYLLLNW